MALENGTPKNNFMLQDWHENDAQISFIQEKSWNIQTVNMVQ
jgi:hypothetical protein